MTRHGWKLVIASWALVGGLLAPDGAAAIISGQAAQPGAFPSLAKVINYYHPGLVEECTGTVVAPRLVLTAAHCAENGSSGAVNEASDYLVVTGNVDWTASPRQVLRVARVVPYPGYQRSGALMGSGDAALLVLQQRTDAPSMALATSADSALWKAGVHGIMAGFGDRYPRQTQRPKRLQWAPTVLQSAEWCGRHGIYFHPSTQLCSIDPPRYATGGCNGDSGGPLIVKSGKRAEVEVGILRAVVEPFGIKTECPTSEPTVYTRTEAVARWVGEWTARLGGRRARSKPRAADLRGSPSFVAGRDLSSAQRISR